jgi:hypothetical protein
MRGEEDRSNATLLVSFLQADLQGLTTAAVRETRLKGLARS